MNKKETVDFENILSGIIDMMRSLGEYLEIVGKLEGEDPQYREFVERMKKNPEYILDIMSDIPEDIAKDIMELMLRMIFLSNKASNLSNLLPNEKVNVGRELKNLANMFQKLADKVREENAKKS